MMRNGRNDGQSRKSYQLHLEVLSNRALAQYFAIGSGMSNYAISSSSQT